MSSALTVNSRNGFESRPFNYMGPQIRPRGLAYSGISFLFGPIQYQIGELEVSHPLNKLCLFWVARGTKF